MIKDLTLLLFLIVAASSQNLSNAQPVKIYNGSGVLELIEENDQIIDPESDQVLYTVKGNLIFKGASTDQDDIVLLVKSENLFSKKKIGEVLNATMEEIVFSINNGNFFLGEFTDREMLLGYFDYDKNGDLLLFNGNNQEIIARFRKDYLTTGKLVAIFYHFAEQYNLDEKAATVLEKRRVEAEYTDISETSGSIRRIWDTGTDEFVWDGQMLTRKWNSFDFEEWTFDGTSLRRAWYAGSEEFIWDGRVLRRRWYESPDEFEWDGRILRRRYGPMQDEYIIQGNIIKPYLSNNQDKQWEIDGQVPIPIIALVIFDLLRK